MEQYNKTIIQQCGNWYTSGLLQLVQRGGDWVRPQPAQPLHRCTKCNRPPINSQRILFDVAL